jgi:signal transduction histidine kinase
VLLEKELDSGARVRVDALRLQRCVQNVLKNAVEAQEAEGGGRIQVRTVMQDGRPLIVVEDDGPGIPPEDLERVFEPLYSNKSYGTGLGLSIVRRIMEGHGGHVQIESTVGEGTTVTLSLPPECLVDPADDYADQAQA